MVGFCFCSCFFAVESQGAAPPLPGPQPPAALSFTCSYPASCLSWCWKQFVCVCCCSCCCCWWCCWLHYSSCHYSYIFLWYVLVVLVVFFLVVLGVLVVLVALVFLIVPILAVLAFLVVLVVLVLGVLVLAAVVFVTVLVIVIALVGALLVGCPSFWFCCLRPAQCLRDKTTKVEYATNWINKQILFHVSIAKAK